VWQCAIDNIAMSQFVGVLLKSESKGSAHSSKLKIASLFPHSAKNNALYFIL